MDCAAPIIIIGPGRSETTLLARMLDSHPDINFYKEPDFLIPKLWRAIWAKNLGGDSHILKWKIFRETASLPDPKVSPRELFQEGEMVVKLQDIRQEQGCCCMAPFTFDQRLHFCGLFEDERPLGPVVDSHQRLREEGGGAYSIWETADKITIYFPTSDNSDPRTNGRTHTLRSGGQAPPQESLEPQPITPTSVNRGTALDQQVCAEPWQNMIINIDGNVSPCCFWANYQNSGIPLGNTNEQSLEDIWNGEGYRWLRWNIVHHNEPGFPCYECMAYKMGGNRYPAPLTKFHPVEDSLSGRNYHLNRREYDHRQIELTSRPVEITFVSTAKCNITCTFCNQYTQRLEGLAPRRETKEEVLALVPYLSVLNWQGGECFLDPYFMKFLRTFKPGDNPNLRLGIPTNGMLAGAEVANCLDKFNGLGIVFSIDSFTPQTYEKLRVGAKFDQVMENMRRIMEVCRNGPDRSVRVQSCIMKANFLELTHMLEYAVREGLNVSFSPVLVWPPNEIINVFANFAEESKGWEEELSRAQNFIDVEIARGNQTFSSSSLFNPKDTIHEVADIFHKAKERYSHPHKVRVALKKISVSHRPADEILNSFFHNEGFCYITRIIKKYDGININCVVCENGQPLPYAGVLHDDIRKKGEGRCSIWPGQDPGEHYILLSATDNSDPRLNGKTYTLQYQITSPTDRFGRKRQPLLVAVEKGNHSNIFSYLNLAAPGEYFIDIPRDVDLSQVIFYTVADYLDYSERNFINQVELQGGGLSVDLQVIREDREDKPAKAEALASPVVAAADMALVHPEGAPAGNGLAEIIRHYPFPTYKPATYNEALLELLERGKHFNSSFIYDAIIHYRYRQVAEKYLPGPPECTLQVGPGGSLGCEVLFALWGVKQACTVDPFPLLSFDLDLFMKTLGSFFEVMRWFNGNGGPVPPVHQTLGNGHFAVGDSIIRHFYPRSFEDTGLPDTSIDFLFSHATLEHVRDPRRCIAETWRVLRPGGLTAHCIDLRDHRNFEQPLAYLQWPPEAWERLMARHCRGDGSLYQNRWRANEFREAFSQAGFEVLEYRPELQVETDRLAAELPRFDPKYRDFPLEDLAITTIFIVAQKPIWVHQSPEIRHVRHCGRD